MPSLMLVSVAVSEKLKQTDTQHCALCIEFFTGKTTTFLTVSAMPGVQKCLPNYPGSIMLFYSISQLL